MSYPYFNARVVALVHEIGLTRVDIDDERFPKPVWIANRIAEGCHEAIGPVPFPAPGSPEPGIAGVDVEAKSLE